MNASYIFAGEVALLFIFFVLYFLVKHNPRQARLQFEEGEPEESTPISFTKEEVERIHLQGMAETDFMKEFESSVYEQYVNNTKDLIGKYPEIDESRASEILSAFGHRQVAVSVLWKDKHPNG